MSADAVSPPLLPAVGSKVELVLGPLPDTTLAEIRNDAINQSRLSETGTAYWGSNWREVRKLYTAAEMQAYAAQERATERDRWADATRAIMCGELGTQVRHKLEAGQGTDTPDGRAWLAALQMLDGGPNAKVKQGATVLRCDSA